MITKDEYVKIRSRLDDFKYNSLKYTEFESIKTYDILYNDENTDVLITFIPKEWVNPLKQADFEMYAVWNDYFSESINLLDTKVDIDKIQANEYDKVSEVTLACRGQSRGFSGQTTEWVRQWVEGREPALPSHAINSTILVKRLNTNVVGAICIATYAHESEKGAIL